MQQTSGGSYPVLYIAPQFAEFILQRFTKKINNIPTFKRIHIKIHNNKHQYQENNNTNQDKHPAVRILCYT